MAEREVSRGDESLLARMMDLKTEGLSHWDARDLEAVFEHQLRAPLESDLAAMRPGMGAWLAELNAGLDPPVRTFGDLFSHAQPPRELLDLVKDFAKKCRSDPEGPLPDDVAAVLYLAAIAAARTRRGERITRLADEGLRHGMGWAVRQTWLDPGTRGLLEEGRTAFGG